jgi:hypothetical protein
MKHKHNKTHQPTGYMFRILSVRPEFAVAAMLGVSIGIGNTTRPGSGERIDNKK